MNEITLTSGVKEYRINGKAILRFNPSDPAMYKRFAALVQGIEKVGKKMSQVASASPTHETMISTLDNCDREIKELLADAFGSDNNFDNIFEGCSSFASTDTGEWVITNFLNTIRPIIESEMEGSLKAKASAAKLNREQRRAAQRR